MMKLPVLMVLSLSIGLSGCGFHLKGQSGISQAITQQAHDYWQNHRLLIHASAAQSKQGQAILLQLDAFEVNYQLVDSKESASQKFEENHSDNVWLEVPPVNFQSRQTAQSALGSTTAEILVLKQSYQLFDHHGKVLTSGTVTTQRDRQVNPQALLASDSEKQAFLDDMSWELAEQLVQRLNAYAAIESPSPTVVNTPEGR
ncbi:hypothetical protein [Thiomicrorhabdus indica]|uniref:LPS-assembly lipoprotein LptE n=1 Tax=Thiomicrorhabdus indica TaxID=2267253 RepID=UPI00102D7E12|nr:hypothetical protein [Thiomicrorhabdus indica]